MPRGRPLKCPRCNNLIDSGSGFGMVECSHCGEIIMVGDLPPVVDEVLQPPAEEKSGLIQEPLAPEIAAALDISVTDEPLPVGDHELEFRVNSEVVFETTGLVGDAAVGPAGANPVEGQSSEPQSPEFQNQVTLILPSETPPAPVSGSLTGISDFANQQQASSGFGGLVYDVYIEGIDTSELRQDLSTCLSDPKLKFDKTQILSQVKEGKLVLRDLNPVRASVLLNQLKHLSFRINWKSHQLIKESLMAIIGFFICNVLLILALTLSAATHVEASDWARHEVNLKGYATRINNMQEDIQALIIKKNQNKDPQVRDELLKQIIKQNDDLQRLYKDYKAEQEHIRFEHPEQGDKTERKYRHVKLKSLDELESEVGLDGQLNRIKRKVEQTYPLEKTTESPSPLKAPSPHAASPEPGPGPALGH